MKKFWGKFVAILICINFIFASGVSSIVAYANTAKTTLVYNGFKYTYYSPTEISIQGYDGNSSNIVIPDAIEGKPVVCIVAHAFYGDETMESITIPKSVKYIGESAFYGCKNLKEITIPDGVTDIYREVFNKCTNLETINLPDSVTNIWKLAFNGCSSLKNIKIPSKTKWIDEMAFAGCSSLTSVEIPEGVTKLYIGTFSSCTSLKDVKLSSNITSMETGVFEKCTSLENIDLPDKLTSMGTGIFYCCTSLKSIVIPNGVKIIPDRTFWDCKKLVNVNLPNTLTTIKASAFYECKSLESITVPNGVTTIENHVFASCTSLKNVQLPETLTSLGQQAFSSCKSLKSIKIPNSISSMGNSTFFNCENLETVEMPESLTAINYGIFSSCYKLINFEIPKNVTSIGESAFSWCKTIETIKIPNKVSSIGAGAFEFCINLKNAYIPRNVTSIDDTAFDKNYFSQLTIYGESGSAAEDYAKKFNIKFVAIGGTSASTYPCPSFNKKTQYAIHVSNQDSQAIKDALVTLDSKFAKTDKNGWAIVEKTSSLEGKLTVQADKYISFSQEKYLKSSTGKDEIILYEEGQSKHKLKYAYYAPFSSESNSYGIEVNMISGLKRINKGKIFKFGIKCEPISTEKVVKYELYQNKNKIATSTDGNFYNLSVDKFSEGSGVAVRVYSTNTKYVSTSINLEILKDPAKADFSFSIGDKWSLDVPDDVFLLGGAKINLDLPQLPGTLYYKDGVVRAGVNINIQDFENSQSIKTKFEKLFAKTASQGYVTAASISDKDFEGLMDDLDLIQTNYESKVPGIDKKVKVRVAGYGEGKINSDGLAYLNFNIVMKIDYKVLDKTYFKVVVIPVANVPVPITASVDSKVKSNSAFSIGYDYEKLQHKGDVKLNINPEFNLYGAFGYKKILSGGVYGSNKLETEIQLAGLNTTPGVNKVDLTGEAGLKGYVFFTEFEHPWFTKTANLYARNTKRSYSLPSKVNNNESEDIYNLSNYTEMDRSYLEKQSNWKGEKKASLFSLKSTSSTNGVQDLITNTYPVSSPKIISSKNKTVMVYLQDNKDRSTYNMTQLMYSVYDKNSGSWSAPQSVDKNETADYSPYLYSDGNDIYLVYQDCNKTFDNVDDMSDYAKAMNISASKFDEATNSFSTINTVNTDKNSYNSQPRITMVDNKLTVVWVANANGDLFGTNNTNKIVYSQNTNNTWSQPSILEENLNSVIDINVGKLNNKLWVAYAIDEDNDLTTYDDTILYMKNMGENKREITKGSITNLQFATNPKDNMESLLWYENGNIGYSSDGINHQLLLEDDVYDINTDFKVLSNKILYVSGEENSANIKVIEYENGKFTDAVKLTDENKYIKDISVTLNDDKLISIFMKSNIKTTEDGVDETSTLSWLSMDNIFNIGIDSVDYDYEKISPGSSLPISIGIKNVGRETSKNLLLKVEDKDGNLIFTQNISKDIESGKIETVNVNMTVPNNISTDDYVISVYDRDNSENVDDSDNEAKFNLYCTDLEVTSEQSVLNENNQLTLGVENKGGIDSGFTLEVYKDDDSSEALFSQHTENLSAGESRYIILNASDYFNDGDISDLKIVIVPDENDYNDCNNITLESITKTVTATFVSDGLTVGKISDLRSNLIDINAIENPTKEGYTFKEWTTVESDESTLVDFSNLDVVIEKDTTYYALWKEDKVTEPEPDPDPTPTPDPDPTPTPDPEPEVTVNKVSNLKSTATTTSTVSLSWSKVDDCQGYEVYRYNSTKKNYDKITTISDKTTVTYKDSSRYSATTYIYKVRAYKKVNDKTYYGDYSDTFKIVTKPLKPTSKVSSTTSSTVKLSWNQVSRASGYSIYRYNISSKTYDYIGKVTSGSTLEYTDTGRNASTKYSYKVRAYRTVDGKTYYGDYSSIVSGTTKVGKPTLKVSDTSTSGVTLSWSKVSGASGYDIYRYNSSTKKYSLIKTITSGSALKYTNTGRTSATTYSYKIRAYKTVNNTKEYGDYSSIKKGTTKPLTPTVKLTAGTKSIKVSWNKISRASGYAIYRSTSKTGTYKLVKTVTSGSTTSYTNTGLTKGKTYYYKVRAYKTVDSSKIYSSYSSIKYTKSK